MELDLGLSLSPSSKLGFDFDLNKNSAIGSGLASSVDAQKLCFQTTFALEDIEEERYVSKPRLFALNDQPNEEDEDPLKSDSSIDYNEEENSEIVGWPPLKTCMIIHSNRHRHSHNHHRYPYHHHGRRRMSNNPTARIERVGSSSSLSLSSAISSTRSSMYVKVKMDGVAIARKVDIKLFDSYESLTNSLISMFSQYEDCDQEDTNYTFIFQGKEGDLLLPGDLPWKNFRECVHRISIIRDRTCAYTRCLF